jgi:hypothetical protein
MTRFSSFLLFIPAIVCLAQTGLARDTVEVQWNSTVRECCHLLRFPQGWQMPKFVPKGDGTWEVYGSITLEEADYEFRIPGELSTRFLVRAFDTYLRHYTKNFYEVDLADPHAIPYPASEDAWNSATIVPLRYKGPAAAQEKFVQSRGFRFPPSGDHSHGYTLSPDRAVLIIQSWTGTLGPSGGSDVPGDFSISLKFGDAHGKLFFDAYNADTGKKLVTIVTKFINILPEEVFDKTGWVTERYFFVPLDERRDKSLICDFGRNRK